jgi:hypothetical protein
MDHPTHHQDGVQYHQLRPDRHGHWKIAQIPPWSTVIKNSRCFFQSTELGKEAATCFHFTWTEHDNQRIICKTHLPTWQKIYKYFTAPAIEAGIHMTWDPRTKKVSSEEDREVNNVCCWFVLLAPLFNIPMRWLTAYYSDPLMHDILSALVQKWVSESTRT